MIIKTPNLYISEKDAIKKAGEYIKEYSHKPLIIGSRKALDAAYDELKKSLESSGIASDNIDVFAGYPSENKFEYYSNLVKETNADAIIALGGGRVLDTAKATADLANIPVITIPTIAATCAAWAGLTVQYDDEGSFVKIRPLKKSPELIIADTRIILSAPLRYLFAGVVDTFAKFYEVRPTLERAKDSLNLDIALYASKLAYEKLEKNVFRAIEEAEKGIYGQAAKDTVDSIIYLAGFAGSFQSNEGYYSFAHPFYHISARFPNTRHKLHGEKVAYGILTQLFLENKDELKELSHQTVEEFNTVGWNEDEIVKAILDTDELVSKYKETYLSLHV